jgi:hypothetical protein
MLKGDATMNGDRQGEDVREQIAARVGALVILKAAQMMDPARTRPWTQQELIVTLCDRGFGSKEIVAALGVPRTIVDPTLSRHRKGKGMRRGTATPREGAD